MGLSPQGHIKRANRWKAERSNYDDTADQVANLVAPRKSVLTERSPGEQDTVQIYDETAVLGSQKCAAGIYAYTIQGNRWFALKPRNKQLQENDEIKRWFSDVSEKLLSEIMSSNFPRASYEGLQDWVTMPAMCLYLEEGKESALNFQAYAFGSYAVANNADGIVDTIYRSFKLTPRQAAQKWGKDKLHEKMREMLSDEMKCDTLCEFLHCVYPRDEYDGKKLDALNMRFASEYIDVKYKHKLSEGGYQEFPYFVCRFNKKAEDVYGHSPAMDLLPAIRGVNKMQQTMLIAAEKAVNPPWLIPDDGTSSYNFSARAGSKNYWRVSPVMGNNKPEPVIIQSDLKAGNEMIMRIQQKIENGFMLDLFNALAQQTENMTATEVLQRVEEKLNALAPSWGNLESEWLSPMIVRALGILMRRRAFDAPPQELQVDPNFDITYYGKIALAADMLKARAFFQFSEAVAPLMAANPEFAAAYSDTINAESSLREIANGMGLSSRFTYSEEVSAERKEARQAAQAEAAAAQQVEQLASAAGKLPDKVVEEGLQNAAVAA